MIPEKTARKIRKGNEKKRLLIINTRALPVVLVCAALLPDKRSGQDGLFYLTQIGAPLNHMFANAARVSGQPRSQTAVRIPPTGVVLEYAVPPSSAGLQSTRRSARSASEYRTRPARISFGSRTLRNDSSNNPYPSGVPNGDHIRVQRAIESIMSLNSQ